MHGQRDFLPGDGRRRGVADPGAARRAESLRQQAEKGISKALGRMLGPPQLRRLLEQEDRAEDLAEDLEREEDPRRREDLLFRLLEFPRRLWISPPGDVKDPEGVWE